MLKNVTLFLFLMAQLFFSCAAFAQIPNKSFEEWPDSLPASWHGSNNVIRRSAEAYSGSSSVKLQTGMYLGYVVAGVIRSGENGNGFTVSERYNTISCYYKFSPSVSTSYFNVTVEFYKGEERIGIGYKSINGEHNEFTPVTVPVNYQSADIPDRGVVILSVGEDPQYQVTGTYAIIDEISFSAITDVNDKNNIISNYRLEQNFPNPFNPETTIRYSVAGQPGQYSKVSLKIYSVTGAEVAVLVNESKPAGEYETKLNVGGLPSGVYFYQLKAGTFIRTRKMTLLK